MIEHLGQAPAGVAGPDRHQPPHRHILQPDHRAFQQPQAVLVQPLLVIDRHHDTDLRQFPQQPDRRQLQQRRCHRHVRCCQAQRRPHGACLRRRQARQRRVGYRVQQVSQVGQPGLPSLQAGGAQDRAGRLCVGGRAPHRCLADPRRARDYRRCGTLPASRQRLLARRELGQSAEQRHPISVTTRSLEVITQAEPVQRHTQPAAAHDSGHA